MSYWRSNWATGNWRLCGHNYHSYHTRWPPVFVGFIAIACCPVRLAYIYLYFVFLYLENPTTNQRRPSIAGTCIPSIHLQVSSSPSEELEPEASASLLKSSPNILENFAYDEFHNHQRLKRMATSPNSGSGSGSSSSTTASTSSSSTRREPKFCDTLERHAFMRNVINTQPESVRRYSSPGEKEAQVRRSLEEITKDLKEIEQFVSATEELLQKEKEQEQILYSTNASNKENKSPSPVKKVTYKINAYKAPPRRHRPGSPRFYHSRLYFRNGRIGCVESTEHQNNVGATHALVKHILRHEKPLVSPDSVRRVLEPESFEMVPLPGAVPTEIVPDPIALQRAEELAAATGQVVLPKEEEEEDQEQGDSQPVIDEDEQDVQICYNESPELQNEDRNERTQRTPSINESEIVAVDEPETELNVDMDLEHRKPSSAGSLDSQGKQFLRDQVRHLVRRFTARANKVKSRIELPPTPSSSSTASSPSPPPTKSLHPSPEHKVRLVPAGQSPHHRGRLFEADTTRSNAWLCSSLCGANNDERTLDPQGKIYISWLCVVSLSFLYNAWVIPLRASFPFQTKENTNIWLACDFCADIIYLLDVVFFKHRVMYLFEGFWVKNKNLTRKNYMRKLQFKVGKDWKNL